MSGDPPQASQDLRAIIKAPHAPKTMFENHAPSSGGTLPRSATAQL